MSYYNSVQVQKISSTGGRKERGCRAINLHAMTFENKSIPSQGFPNPIKQAAVILEICEGDFRAAGAIATTNLRFANIKEDILYWSAVEQALVFEQSRRLLLEANGHAALEAEIHQPVGVAIKRSV